METVTRSVVFFFAHSLPEVSKIPSLCLVFPFLFFFFLAGGGDMPVACRSSRARDRTCPTIMIRVTTVTRLDP